MTRLSCRLSICRLPLRSALLVVGKSGLRTAGGFAVLDLLATLQMVGLINTVGCLLMGLEGVKPPHHDGVGSPSHPDTEASPNLTPTLKPGLNPQVNL